MAETWPNDAAHEAIELVIQKLSTTMDFDLKLPYALMEHRSLEGEVLPRETGHLSASRLMTNTIYRTAPHAFGVIPEDEQFIELICATTMSSKLFWDYVQEKLVLEPEQVQPVKNCWEFRLSDLRALDLPAYPEGLKLAFRYARHDWTGTEIPTQADHSDLAAAYDAQHLHRKLTEMACWKHNETTQHSLRSGYLLLRQIARNNGILSRSLRMLSEECLLHIYAEAFIRIEMLLEYEHSPAKILQTSPFVLIADGGMEHWPTVESGRSFTEDMTPEAIIAVREAFRRGKNEDGLTTFSQQYHVFFKMEARCWVPKKRLDFTQSLPGILLKLQECLRQHTTLRTRVWPYSLSREEGEYSYLFGVYKGGDQPLHDVLTRENFELSAQEHLELTAELDQVMNKFVLDSNEASLVLELLSQPEAVQYISERQSTQDVPATKAHTSVFDETRSTRFRTAGMVLSRLHWDSKHENIDYEVGYVDRFENDLMWKLLDRWERFTEEIDFIPEHRIWQFRRVADGVVVWDRGKRLDMT